MPQSSTLIEREPYLRVLLMGAPKVGKTTSTIASLAKAFGSGYVFCCGDKGGMKQASARAKFTWDNIRDEHEMEAAIKEAKQGVKSGAYKWIVVDDFSLYASWLEGELRLQSARANQKGEPDGRRYWPEYRTRILNIARRLFDAKAHIVFCTHYTEHSPEIDGQLAKSGPGVVPMIGGAARVELPAIFQDVLFMEKDKNNKRIFKVNPEGVWGPGCRSTDQTKEIDADFGVFYKLTQGK